MLISRVKLLLKKIIKFIGPNELLLEAELRTLRSEISRTAPDNICLKGFKVYSQNDEDGIIEEIFRLIDGRFFVEAGCGNGLENNTHYLLLKGWRGIWIDGDESNINAITKNLPHVPERLRVLRQFVDKDNAKALVASVGEIDFLSLDIDGNDLPVLREMLRASRPKVICVEYNPRFPPPMVISIEYDPRHTWARDEYHGASLQAFVNELTGYRLVTCTLMGANAFFVRDDLASPFPSIPIDRLYQSPKAYPHPSAGHPPSYRFLANVLRRSRDPQ